MIKSFTGDQGNTGLPGIDGIPGTPGVDGLHGQKGYSIKGKIFLICFQFNYYCLLTLLLYICINVSGEPGALGYQGDKGDKGDSGRDGSKGDAGYCPPPNFTAGFKGFILMLSINIWHTRQNMFDSI